MKRYLVHKTNQLIKTDSSWSHAILLNDFTLPWGKEKPKETSFKALYDDDFLYLRYDVKDNNINICSKIKNKEDVVNSDRVEIFFRKSDKLNSYYCLEIDPNGLVLDYSASYYRKFDFSWHWPKKHLDVKGNIKPDGYQVDVKISLESLRELGLLQNTIIEVGLFRADCIRPPNRGNSAEIKWVSWVDPKTETPDFHVSSAFGVFELE